MDPSPESNESCFVPLAGLKRVYEPKKRGEGAKKHPCPDCHFCQLCSEARCHSCRGSGNIGAKNPGRKLSLLDQICLYERINTKADE